MDSGNVFHASHEGLHVLRFVGDIRYPLAPSVDQFVESLLEESPRAAFLIDLTDTHSIDSTNLGLLARIANRVQANEGPRVTIVSCRDDVSELLISMGFNEVFDIVESSGRSVDDEPHALSTQPADRAAIARTVLEAHRTLMELNERNRDLFRDVVKALEEDGRSGPSAE